MAIVGDSYKLGGKKCDKCEGEGYYWVRNVVTKSLLFGLIPLQWEGIRITPTIYMRRTVLNNEALRLKKALPHPYLDKYVRRECSSCQKKH